MVLHNICTEIDEVGLMIDVNVTFQMSRKSDINQNKNMSN